MAWQGWFSLFLTFLALLTLATTRVRPHMIMMAVLAILSVSGILTPSEALTGFSNEGLFTVFAMFVVAAGVNGSGGIDLLVKTLLGNPVTERRALSRLLLPVMGMSGFLNNTPVVATMIPAINVWARKIAVPPSKLMIPLSYGAILGGTLTLIGTSTNLIVNSQYQVLTGNPGFSLFSIAAVGLPVAVLGFIYMVAFFPSTLPDRSDNRAFENLKEFTLEVQVAGQGPLVGKTIEKAGLRHLRRIFLVEIERNGTIMTAVPPDQKLMGGDRLVFAGEVEAISDLLRINGIIPSQDSSPRNVSSREERRLIEVVVSPTCAAIGQAIREFEFRDRYGAVVLAVARNGERIRGNLGNIRLKPGDTLLLEGGPTFVSRQRQSRDFLLINDLDTDQPRHERAYIAWVILVAIVVAATTGFTSMFNAALVGAGLMIITGCCSLNQAEKSLDIPVLLTIGASFALGMALQKTGVAGYLAESIVALSHGIPWLTLILVYIAVSLLTEVITNNTAAILMLPIALEITEKGGMPSEPFVFAIMMAASASFATPLGYQTNLMVYGPGNYQFADFLKVGIPMNIVIGAITVVILITGWL